jgi:hypothetical protein
LTDYYRFVQEVSNLRGNENHPVFGRVAFGAPLGPENRPVPNDTRRRRATPSWPRPSPVTVDRKTSSTASITAGNPHGYSGGVNTERVQ